MQKLLLQATIAILVVMAGSMAYLALSERPESESLAPAPVGQIATSTPPIQKEPTNAAPEQASATTSADRATMLASTVVAATPTAPPTSNLTSVGGSLLKATVNILCIASRHSGLRSISGTGVIIDSRGLILTAAHIGQYFLLTDYPRTHNVACTIRTGGPATNAYLAQPVYVSPSWIDANADNLSLSAPKGTGENDFAILAITGSATKSPLPTAFPFVPLSIDTPQMGEKVAISGYAAQYLGGDAIQNDLYPTIVFDSITDRYTFGTKTVDVISITGSAAAQEGSSGGGIADENGGIVGMITTSSIKGDVSEHTLNAITPLHMRASFDADSKANLDLYLSGNPLTTLVENFKTEAHTLAVTLNSTN